MVSSFIIFQLFHIMSVVADYTILFRLISHNGKTTEAVVFEYCGDFQRGYLAYKGILQN